jgi:MoaA/NifB/PqqE/SkfB family radical SAM enzyme
MARERSENRIRTFSDGGTSYIISFSIKGQSPGTTWLHNSLAEGRARLNWPAGQGHSILFTIELTDKCTFRCDHCFAEAGPEKNTFIDFGKVAEIAAECEGLFAGYEASLIRLTGGEAMLHPQIFEIVREFSGRREALKYEHLEVETNGSWASDDATAAEYVRMLKDAGADMLSMTVDYLHCKSGRRIGADIHENFNRIEKAASFEGLRFRDILAGSTDELDPRTAAELEEHKKTCGHCLSLPSITPVGRGRQLDEKLWGNAYSHATCDLTGCRLTPPTFLAEMGDRYVHQDEITVGPDGSVYPCNSGRRFAHASLAIGNVHERPIRDIVRDPQNPVVDIIREEGLQGLSMRAGVMPWDHWRAYWKMTPCGWCHELLREHGGEISQGMADPSSPKQLAMRAIYAPLIRKTGQARERGARLLR